MQQFSGAAAGEARTEVGRRAEDRQLTPSKVGISTIIFDLDR
jgi:hypothetical protein